MAKSAMMDPKLREFAITGVKAEIDRLNEVLRALEQPSSAAQVRAADSRLGLGRATRISKMSPASRKAISERMKAYWAGRREGTNGRSSGEAPKRR
jgi:hypothetical protein